MLKLAFNAQGSRVIIVVVQVRALKNICSSSGGGAQEKKGDENQFTTKIGGKKTSLGPSYFVL
jgi:hypothetical protein